MKRPLLWIAVSVIAVSQTSCGLPGALINSAGRLLDSAGALAGPAAAAAL